ncbi:MAG: response regulator transcription factor [Anaerolineales bacterium]
MTAKENMSIMAAVLPYPGQISLFDRLVRRSAILRKVLITDDRLASRKGLRALMLTQPDIQVIGEAANGKKAIQLIEERKPDVVIMDAFMPVMNGLEATRIIKNSWEGIRVVILTLHNNIREEALAAGADAFLVKGCSPDDLIREIRNERRD